MTTPNGNPAVQACAIRVCRLTADGAPIYASATGAYANSAFATLSVKPNKENHDDFTEKNACGSIYINYRDCDLVKWWDVSLTILYPDPCLMEMMLGGALLLDGEVNLGYEVPALCNAACPGNVSLEVWAKDLECNTQNGTYPWYRFLMPLTTGWIQGDLEFANKPGMFVMDGYAIENPNFTTGPFDDWTSTELSGGTALNSTRSLEWIYSTVLPTPLAPGYLMTPAAPT